LTIRRNPPKLVSCAAPRRISIRFYGLSSRAAAVRARIRRRVSDIVLRRSSRTDRLDGRNNPTIDIRVYTAPRLGGWETLTCIVCARAGEEKFSIYLVPGERRRRAARRRGRGTDGVFRNVSDMEIIVKRISGRYCEGGKCGLLSPAVAA